MIQDKILNEMTIDELRNYVSHFGKLEDRFGELNYIKDEVIECLQRLCNKQSAMYDCLAQYTAIQGKIRKIESEMYLKYQDALPEPYCDSEKNDIFKIKR